MSRKIARDAAMRMLYAYELTGELNHDMIQETIEPAALDAEDMQYLRQVTEGAVEQKMCIRDRCSGRASVGCRAENGCFGRLSQGGRHDDGVKKLIAASTGDR